MRILAGAKDNETGAAAVELVFAVPILVLLAAGLLDLSMLVRCNIALDSAATATVRYCMDNPDNAESVEVLREYLSTVEPDMADATIGVSKGDVRKEAYEHFFYVDESEDVISRQSFCSFQPFSIKLTYRTPYRTLIGKTLSAATGGDGMLVATCTKAGVMDRTDGDTW